MRNAGPAIVKIQETPHHPICPPNICGITVTVYSNPARIKTTPPTISRFQDIIRTANKTNAGILCISKPTTICQKLKPGSKTSKENNAKKHINIIDRILGVQYRYLLIFFPIFLLYQKTPFLRGGGVTIPDLNSYKKLHYRQSSHLN